MTTKNEVRYALGPGIGETYQACQEARAALYEAVKHADDLVGFLEWHGSLTDLAVTLREALTLIEGISRDTIWEALDEDLDDMDDQGILEGMII